MRPAGTGMAEQPSGIRHCPSSWFFSRTFWWNNSPVGFLFAVNGSPILQGNCCTRSRSKS